jgi:hypothetical protein
MTDDRLRLLFFGKWSDKQWCLHNLSFYHMPKCSFAFAPGDMWYTCFILYGALLLGVDRLLEAAQYRRVHRARSSEIEKALWHLPIGSCIVETAIRNSPSRLANRNSLRVGDSQMPQAVAHHAAQHVSRRVVDIQVEGRGQDIANARHAQCTPSSVQVVAMRHRCLSSHATTGPSIVAIVIVPKALAAHVTSARVGERHESHSGESGRFI